MIPLKHQSTAKRHNGGRHRCPTSARSCTSINGRNEAGLLNAAAEGRPGLSPVLPQMQLLQYGLTVVRGLNDPASRLASDDRRRCNSISRQLQGMASQFKGLLDGRVEKASIGRDGLSIQRKVDADLQSAENVLGAPSATDDGAERRVDQASFMDDVEKLAVISPAAAIAFASGRLEAVLRDLLADSLSPTRPLGLSALLRAADKARLLTSSEADAGQYLVKVRNQAVHTAEASTVGQAQEFAELATRIASAARTAAGQTATDGTGPL